MAVKTRSPQFAGEKGYMLLSVMLMVALMLVGLSVELPRIVQEIKREKEQELMHRGNEYKGAIRKYFRKFGQYPVSIDQLQSTNNMRFLRKRYKDPFTGKDDWRILHPAEVQVNAVNGGAVGLPGQVGQPGGSIGAPGATMGQPIGGTSGQSIGSGFGQASTFGSTTPGFGASGPTPSQNPGFGTSTPTAGTTAGTQSGSDPNAPGTTSGASTGGITAASNMPGASTPLIGGGPFVGVSSVSKLKSIKVINGKDHYNDWQFVYLPQQDIQSMAAPVGSAVNGTNPIGGNAAPGFGQPTNNPMNNPSTPINNNGPSQTNPNPPPSNPTGPGQ